MTKQEFLDALRAGLSGLTEADASERITFYSEMLDDRIEEGLSEEAAVAQIGSVDEIVASILAEIPQKQKDVITRVDKPTHHQATPKKEEKKHMETWQIILLILGFPLWLPLLIAAFAVLLSLLASLWSIIVSFWAVFASLAGVGLGCTLGGVIYGAFSSPAGGVVAVGAGLASAGLAIPAFYGCVAATKGSAWLTKTVCRACCKFLFGRGRTE